MDIKSGKVTNLSLKFYVIGADTIQGKACFVIFF